MAELQQRLAAPRVEGRVEDRLADFLSEAAAAPFAPGEWDCAMTVARWVLREVGVDPAAALRGRYRSELGWKRIVNRAGGLLPLMSRLARGAGLHRIAPARALVGDVGLVRVPGVGCFAAVRGHGRWVVKLDRGLFARDLEVIAAWRLPRPRGVGAQAVGLAIGGLLFNIGAPLAVVNFFAVGIGGSLVLGAGALAATALLTPRVAAAASVRPSDGQQVLRQAVPPRWKHYGRVRVAGSVFWFDSDVTTDIFYLGLMVNHGRIDAFEEFFIDKNEVTVDGSGNVTTSPYSTVTTQLLTRLGLDTETEYSDLDTVFGTSDVRGDGVASVLGIFEAFANSEDQFENYPSSRPAPKFTIRASLCYDPRESSQDPLDKSTWAWSENEVVCRLTFLIDPDGMGIPWARIEPNAAEWRAAADVCDEQIVSVAAGGEESLYRVALTYLLTERPIDVLRRFEAASDGRTWQKRDGSIGVAVGRFVEPAVTIPSEHIIGYKLVRGRDRLRAAAGVRSQYLSSQHDYREQDAEPWPDGETVVALEEDRVLSPDPDFKTAPSHGQARRLMKRAYLRATAPWTGTVRTTLYGLKALDERYVNLVIGELGMSRSFEVGRFTLDLSSMEVELAVVAVDAAIDAWNPATEEGTAPGVPAGPVWIGKSAGTLVGNFDNKARAFDGDSDTNHDNCANRIGLSEGWIGKNFSPGKRFSSAIVYGSNTRGFVDSGNHQVTLKVRGKAGAAPSGRTDGTLLASLAPFNNTSDESGGRELVSTDTATVWDYIWIDAAHNGDSDDDLLIAEIDWWEFT